METLSKLVNIEYNGPKLAVLTVVIDWFVLITVKTIWRMIKGRYEREYNKHFNEREEAVKAKDIKVMATAGRKLRSAKSKLEKLKPRKIWNFLRVIVPLLLFRNCYICVMNVSFWKPFTKFVAFPKKVLPDDTELQVGFIFFWLTINKFDMKL